MNFGKTVITIRPGREMLVFLCFPAQAYICSGLFSLLEKAQNAIIIFILYLDNRNSIYDTMRRNKFSGGENEEDHR